MPLPFAAAHEWAVVLAAAYGWRTSRDWWDAGTLGTRPAELPSNPAIAYRGVGWQGWDHWLGWQGAEINEVIDPRNAPRGCSVRHIASRARPFANVETRGVRASRYYSLNRFARY